MAATQKSQEFLTKGALHTAVLNPIGSKTFLKKMIPMAISFILHQRVELDESDFNTGSYGGVEYKVFKPKMQNPTLQEVSDWIKGALDALEKNYLRELYLLFESNEEAGVVHESYKFQFKYLGNDVIPMDQQSVTKQDLEEATECLLTAIQSLNIHTAFKENEIKLKMALTYYEDATPSDYQPPFFEIEKESEEFVLNSLAMQPRNYLHLGILKTGYNTVKCRAKGEVFSMNRSLSSTTNIVYQSVEVIENPPVNSVEECEDILEQLPQISTAENIDLTEEIFQCLCTISVKLKHIDTVLCSQCLTFQHCACLGYLQGNDISDKYVCLQCEKKINDLTPEARDRQKRISIFRLTVAIAYFTEDIPRDVLKMLPKKTASFIFNKLVEQHIFLEENREYKVNMELLNSTFLNALFAVGSKSQQKKRKAIPNSMNLEDVDKSQPNSMVLGEGTCKKRKHPK